MASEVHNALPIPIFDFSPVRNDVGEIVDFCFEWVNAAGLALMSVKLEDIVGVKLLSVASYILGTEGLKQMIQSVEGTESLSLVTQMDHGPVYRNKWVSFVTAPSEAGCLAMMHDVSDVVAQRDAALGQMKMMQAACDAAVGGIAIADADHELVYANPAFCEMLGYKQAELIGMRIDQLTAESEQPARQVEADKLLAEEISQYITDRVYLTKMGEEILMSVSVSMITRPDGEKLSLGHFRDVRAERRAQHDLRTALMKSEEATRLKSEFLANMSHEIRTPLNGVIGMAQVLSYSDLTDQQAEHVDIIQDSGATLMSLLNDILDLSKVEAGRVEISAIEVDLRHKLNRVYKLHQPMAEEKGIGLNLVVHPSIPSRLMVDPVRLHQCVSNLVSNAIKFTSSGQVVVAITGEPVGEDYKLVVHVSDTGIGIAEDKLDAIFESFQQADGSTTRDFGGTGLGLTITRKLAQLMGGDLSVVSEEGRGSIFTLTIMSEAEHTLCGHSRMPQERGGLIGFSGRKVLIVDDNLINRKVILSFLGAYGFAYDEATDGVEALKRLSENSYDLVLMDIHMPNMDGLRATRSLRASGGLNSRTPIIALTADAMSGDRERYLSAGMDGYVSKPIDERELIIEINSVFNQSHNQVFKKRA